MTTVPVCVEPGPPGSLVAIVCTGRGQHPEARIARVSATAPGSRGRPRCRVAWEQGEVMDARMAAGGWHTYTFTCRWCVSQRGHHRARRIKELRLIIAARALADAGKHTLDISLPY